MKRKLTIVLLAFLLWTIDYGLWTVSAQEQTLTLDISVTNPSDEESQEVEVKASLPEELKEEDVVSSDGLKVRFDTEKGSLFVAGKVLLQPAETTIYKIKVRDVWVIPGSEGAPVSDISAHIAAYRESKKKLGAVRNALGTMRERTAQDAQRRRQGIIWPVVLLAIFGTALFVGLKRKEYLRYIRNKVRQLGVGNRRRFVRLPNQAEVEYRFLPEEKINSSIPARDISKGGVCVSLDRPYPPQSVLELKIKLPPYAETLTFRGFVVWQRKVAGWDRKEHYLTGISFGEAAEEDYRKLKEFIGQRRSWLSRLVKRSN